MYSYNKGFDFVYSGKDYSALVTLTELKTHLRIFSGDTSEDNYLSSIIEAATQSAEILTNNQLCPSTGTCIQGWFEGYTYEMPGSHYNTITDITLIDVNGNVTSGITPTYQVQYSQYIYFWLPYTGFRSTLKISFKAGYDSSTVPAIVKQAILIRCAEMYDKNRDGYVNGGTETNIFKTLLRNEIILPNTI